MKNQNYLLSLFVLILFSSVQLFLLKEINSSFKLTKKDEPKKTDNLNSVNDKKVQNEKKSEQEKKTLPVEKDKESNRAAETSTNEDKQNNKFSVTYKTNEKFDKVNQSVQNYQEKCLKFIRKLQLVTDIDYTNMVVTTVPIIVKLNKDELLLLLQDDDSYVMFSKLTSFIDNTTPLLENHLDLPCIKIKFEEVTPSTLIKIHFVELCGKNTKDIEPLTRAITEFTNECLNKDPRLVEDFSELNKLVSRNAPGKKQEINVLDSISYSNPKKEKSPREIQKELLKEKIAIIKLKLLEKKFAEKELCRQDKLKKLDEKLDKIEEEDIKKQNSPVIKDKIPVLTENNSSIKSLDKIEKQLDTQISTVKSALKSLESEKKS